MKLLLLGHSFVRRLHEYVSAADFTDGTPFRLDEFQPSDIIWDYRGGRYIDELWHQTKGPTRHLRSIMCGLPDYVYVEIGTNDVTKVSEAGVSDLRLSITALLEWLSLQPNVKGVAWAEVLVRRLDIRENVSLQKRYSYNVDLDQFNSLRLQVNSIVKTESVAAPTIIVCSHTKFERRHGDGLAADGVHPKDSSMRQYWWSVRGALLQLLKL